MSYVQHNSKDIDNRLATMEGHVKAIRQMINDGKSCDEVLLQLTALKGAVDKLSNKILIEHANTCVKYSLEQNDLQAYDDFINVLNKYLNK